LRKFGVFGRAATSSTQQQQRRKPPDPTFRADQLSQLAREVFDLAIQSGPKGFARTFQAANAFASVGRYLKFLLHRSLVRITDSSALFLSCA
jgi:hypothetical protein